MNSSPYPDNLCDLDTINKIIKTDINKKFGDYEETILHYMARHDHFDNVKYLMENGADVNARDYYLNTPLHDAAANSRFEIVQYLLLNGADKFAININEFTAADAAGSCDSDSEIVEYIRSFEPLPTKGVHMGPDD